MTHSIETEIRDLHQFFQDWFNAVLPPNDESFVRFTGVMATDFEMISPDGHGQARDPLCDRLRRAHGVHAGDDPPFRIRIERVNLRPLRDGVVLATYEEWQETAGVARGRLSSAIFAARPDTPNGYEWLHLHEVWLPTET